MGFDTLCSVYIGLWGVAPKIFRHRDLNVVVIRSKCKILGGCGCEGDKLMQTQVVMGLDMRS